MPAPRVAVGPHAAPFATEAIVAGGGLPVAVGEPADALVWLVPGGVDRLEAALQAVPGIRCLRDPTRGGLAATLNR